MAGGYSEHSSRYCQALSIVFQLLDVVEENTSNQVRRRADDPRRREGEPGFWLWNLNDLRQRGFSEEEVRQAMRGVSAEPVLTAHPTEAKRATVLEHHRTLYLLLVERDNRHFTEVELAIFERRMKAALERLWRTGEIRQERPDIASEVHRRAALSAHGVSGSRRVARSCASSIAGARCSARSLRRCRGSPSEAGWAAIATAIRS